jgi:CheY-like chemotaxis protein
MLRHHLPQVLVVDDDAGLRDLLRTILEAEGYPVLQAADGLDALAILHTAPSPLVMLSNHQMPRLDGPGLFARILADPLLPARHAYLYMTAMPWAILPAFARQLAALQVQVVWKPFDVAELLAAIAAAASRLSSAPPPSRTPAGSRS